MAKQGGVGVGADYVLRSVAVQSWRFDRGVTCVLGGVVRNFFFLFSFLFLLFWEEGAGVAASPVCVFVCVYVLRDYLDVSSMLFLFSSAVLTSCGVGCCQKGFSHSRTDSSLYISSCWNQTHTLRGYILLGVLKFQNETLEGATSRRRE